MEKKRAENILKFDKMWRINATQVFHQAFV